MADERTPAGRRRAAKAKAKAPAPKAVAKARAKAAAPKAKPVPKPKATPKAAPQPLPKPAGPIGTIGTVITRPPIGISTFPVIARPPIAVTEPVTGVGGTVLVPVADAGAAAADVPAPAVTLPPMVRPVVIRDTTQFGSLIRPNIWGDFDVIRESKTVVVSQSPAPNDVVPAGTPVTVTTTVKQLLPLAGLNVAPALINRFRTAGDVEDLVLGANTPTPVQQAVTNAVDYARLDQPDRAAVDEFVNGLVDDPAVLTENDRAQLFNDLSFITRI